MSRQTPAQGFAAVLRTAVMAVLWLWLACAQAPAQAGQYVLQARVEPQSVQVGEVVLYVLTITHTGQEPPEPKPPSFDAARVKGWSQAGTQRMMQTSIVQGRMTQINTVEYRYTFMPTREGTVVLPAASITVGGEEHRSNTVTLSVTSGPPQIALPPELEGRIEDPVVAGDRAMQNALRGALFILPMVETSNPYAGQQVLVSYHLCIDADALAKAGLARSLAPRNAQVPEMAQFLKENVFDLPQQLRFADRTIGSRTYATAPLYQVAVTPTKAGTLTAEPFVLELLVRDARAGARGGAFGLLDDDPFFPPSILGGGGWVTVVARSKELQFDVRPLPDEGRPADFTGAVGDFEITAELDRAPAVADDDIVKLTVKVEGRGDAASLPKPALPAIDGVRVLEEPRSEVSRRVERNQLLSTKQFEYLLRAGKPGRVEFPALSYSVFNPAEGRYEQIRSAPLALEVAANTNRQDALVAASTAGAPTAPAARADAGTTVTNGNEPRYIREGAMTVVAGGIATGDGPWPWLLLALPPLGVLAAWIVARRRARRRPDPAALAAAAAATARRKLRAVSARTGDASAFHAELADSVRGYFSDRFMTGPGPTVEEIALALEERGAPAGLAEDVRGLLERCDGARYAPGGIAEKAMRDALDEAAALVARAEEVR